jgi:hypothetical protein
MTDSQVSNQEYLTIFWVTVVDLDREEILFVRSHYTNATIMDLNLEPEFDFSDLDLSELELTLGITVDEIISVYKNWRTGATGLKLETPNPQYLCVGSSFRMRPLKILLEHNGVTCYFINVKLANEYEVESFWCKENGIHGAL